MSAVQQSRREWLLTERPQSRMQARLGRAYVKLSEASRISAQPGADFKPFIDTLLAQRKDRLVWGSGIRREQPPPATDTLSSSLDGWIADPIQRNLILSRNPAQLYGFDTDD